jgi:metallo-beta-lactamase family protein
LQGDKIVRIFGEEHEVRAKMEEINAYSAHADEGELLDFIGQIPNKPDRMFVVHGEMQAAKAMAEALRKSGISNVTIPAGGERFQI